MNDGLTCKIKSLKFDASRGGSYVVETTHTVPNGKWVLKRPLGSFTQIVSNNLDGFEHLELDDTQGAFVPRPTLYISDDPFGFVCWNGYESHEVFGNHPLMFASARQIHKDELGQYVPTQKVPFATEKILGPEKGATNGDRQRARMGWVQLDEVTRRLRMGTDELLNRYIQFGLHYSTEWDAASIEIAFAPRGDSFKEGLHSIQEYTRSEALTLTRAGAGGHLWVRRGFANTVFRLASLGFVPELTPA